jgi:hypothetical protein
LQRKDESPRPSRPSLLTAEQQAEAERNRILSTLEPGGAAARPAPRSGRARLVWGGLGALLLLAGGGWLARDAGQEQRLSTMATATAGEALLASPGANPPPPPSTPPEVSSAEVLAAPAATINEEGAAHEKQASLADMLSAGASSAPAAKADGGLLGKALDKPSPAPRSAAATSRADSGKPAPKAAPKSAPKPAPKQVGRQAAKPLPVPKAAAKARPARDTTPEQDSDIALLSALVAHAQATAEAPTKPRLGLAEQLAQCKAFGKTKAAQCRARICDGRSKSGECKLVP